jgi:uncharacterized protein (DUF58 family)
MTKRPTRRAVVFVGIGGLLVVVGSTAQAGWLFVLSALVFGIVASSWPARSRLGSLGVTRSLPSHSAVGDECETQLTVQNIDGKRYVPPVRMMDLHQAFDPVALVYEDLAPLYASRTKLRRTAVRRGVFGGGEIVLVSGWPFGLMRSQRSVEVASPITVVPSTVDLHSFPLEGFSVRPGSSDRLAARAGSGEQFLGVREYRSGDDARHIHWRSSARRTNLVVREYEDEATERVALVMAGTEDGPAPDSSFEALVSAAASIAKFALQQGLRIEVLRPGSRGTVDRCSSSKPSEVLDWLATATPVDEPVSPIARAVALDPEPPATVVLIASSRGRSALGVAEAADFVRGRGVNPVTVIADSATWMDDGISPVLPAVSGPMRVLVRDRDLAACLNE